KVAGWVRGFLSQFFHMAWSARAVSRRLVRETGEAWQRLWTRIACRSSEDRTRSRLRSDGMGGARLERTGDPVLSPSRRKANGRRDRFPTDGRWDREAGGCSRHGCHYRKPAFAGEE